LLRFRSRPNTLLDFSSFCVPLRFKNKNMPDRLVVQVEINLRYAQLFLYRLAVDFGFFLRGTHGSLKFPDYPCVHMPRSKSPVVSSALAITR
jgi:hypothetical protein